MNKNKVDQIFDLIARMKLDIHLWTNTTCDEVTDVEIDKSLALVREAEAVLKEWKE